MPSNGCNRPHRREETGPVMTESGRRFSKRTEDFSCRWCGLDIQGNGFTNHCPSCLHSLHVDIHPGDRSADCGGLMTPVQAKRDGKKGIVILHRCEHCGHEKWNRSAEDDDREELTGLLGVWPG